MMTTSMSPVADDTVMMKPVMETHAPDGREVASPVLLLLVEDILNRATLNVDSNATPGSLYAENMKDKSYEASFDDKLDALSYIIERISGELKALAGGEAHSTTLAICNMLAPFSWEAKLVLTLAAFAFNYGEFWFLAQIYATNQLAKSMANRKQLPGVMEHVGALKSRFDVLNGLIQAILKVTRCVVDLKELPSAYISSKVPAYSAALFHIPTAVCWTIRSVVACAVKITSLTSHGIEYANSKTEEWELSTLTSKLTNIYEHLQEQIAICYEHIDEKRSQTLRNLFGDSPETIPIDNIEILKALIYYKYDIQPLVDGTTKERVNIEVLKGKNVLLLISGLDISPDEVSILEQIHIESKLNHQYEVVWIPMIDCSIKWTDPMQKQFEALQSTMPWYSVYRPSLITKVAIQVIEKKWHFRNKPILVVLDPQGRVVSPNAIHMMWIWRSKAFPFTKQSEEAMWKEKNWGLELLVDCIDQTILNWIREGKHIFLYGGDDIEWIRKFTAAAHQVVQATRIPLEMFYVGKSSKQEQVQLAIETIKVEKLSNTLQDLTMVWFFWTRLEFILFSKTQHGKVGEYDHLMQQIKRLLNFDKAGGWAMLSKGSSIMVNGHETTILLALLEYDLWMEHVLTKGYDQAFKDHHDMICPSCLFESRSMAGRIPESIRCPECQGLMERLTTFICCRDDAFPSIYE